MNMDAKKKIEVRVNVDVIKAALRNSDTIEMAALEVPVVNPRNLTLDSTIYAVELRPITKEKDLKGVSMPTLGNYAAVREVVVESLSKGNRDGFITINGVIDISETEGRVIGIKDAYFENAEDAREVAKAITHVNLERVQQIKKIILAEEAYLREQKENNRY